MVIGITGGIGSGKSVVMNVLKEDYHAAIILADSVGHDLMEPGKTIYQELVREFGTGILAEDGTIDRKALSAIVFSDPQLWDTLNRIEHPLIKDEILSRIARYQEDPAVSFIALEAALLIEEDYLPYLDELWFIYVNEETRIKRLAAGRGYSEEKSRNFMKQQLSDQAFREAADRVIDNSGDIDSLRSQLEKELYTLNFIRYTKSREKNELA